MRHNIRVVLKVYIKFYSPTTFTNINIGSSWHAAKNKVRAGIISIAAILFHENFISNNIYIVAVETRFISIAATTPNFG